MPTGQARAPRQRGTRPTPPRGSFLAPHHAQESGPTPRSGYTALSPILHFVAGPDARDQAAAPGLEAATPPGPEPQGPPHSLGLPVELSRWLAASTRQAESCDDITLAQEAAKWKQTAVRPSQDPSQKAPLERLTAR